mgnify:CR=1 FL=1
MEGGESGFVVAKVETLLDAWMFYVYVAGLVAALPLIRLSSCGLL